MTYEIMMLSFVASVKIRKIWAHILYTKRSELERSINNEIVYNLCCAQFKLPSIFIIHLWFWYFSFAISPVIWYIEMVIPFYVRSFVIVSFELSDAVGK